MGVLEIESTLGLVSNDRDRFLLNQSRQQVQSHRNDGQPNTGAREQAEALFRPKQEIIEPSLPADAALAGASTRRPRVLSASAPPQIRQEHERLNSRRTELIKQQHELQAKLDVINNEMRAIDAYNAAKNGKSFGTSRSKQTHQGAGTTSTRRPEQQRAAAVGNKHAGSRPKASPDQRGIQPDEARLQHEERLRKQAGDRLMTNGQRKAG